MLSDEDKGQFERVDTPEFYAKIERAKAIEQAVIAEQAAPAGEAVAEVVVGDCMSGFGREISIPLPYGTKLYTTQHPAECDRCADLNRIAEFDYKTMEDLQAKVAEITAERDILIIDVASHVTVRTEQAGRIARLIERLKAYQQAWDEKDLHKQLSQLVFKEAHGVEFERAYQLLEQQITTLTAYKARSEAVIEKCKAELTGNGNAVEALAAIEEYQKGGE